jgi:hypothetical protein
MSDEPQIYRIKITLKGVKPPIWRRVRVSGDITLDVLHEIIQATMGWWNAHLHQFAIRGTSYGTPYPDFGFGVDMEDETQFRLDQVAPREGLKFTYEYDFGDSWYHELLVERISAPTADLPHPLCLTGRRACPPEDVGGIWGYASFLEAIRDPDHPEHEDYMEWVGDEFDPEAFDLEEANKALRHLPAMAPPITDERLLDVLAALSFYTGAYEREAVDAALELREEITPHLIQILEDVLADPLDFAGDGDYFGHAYALQLLGHFREPRAHEVIVKLARLPGELPFDLFDDTITESLPAIMFATCGGSTYRIVELLTDREANEYCRSAAARALVYAVVEGVVPRREVVSLFGSLFTGDEAPSDSGFWGFVASAVCHLYPEELIDVIRKGYEDELIDDSMIDYPFFEETLQRGGAHAYQKVRERIAHYMPEDVHARMDWWACFRGEQEEESESLAASPPNERPASLPAPPLKERPKRKKVKKARAVSRPPKKKRKRRR